ncbi:LuxR C-terminal-related transcriptional regulator [Streptomyces sp. NPDC047042]|uniref:LuxR C-terminal-related transcriptional regulator n=1 Tax=Streptomyces sp. NPDC047042 TaxID=3154807 RepID=UPI0033D80D5D
MTARLARPPASLLPLTPVQLAIVAKIARGETTTAIAYDLSLTISSVNVQVTLSGRKLGASGRAAVVHATLATHQLPRPQTVHAPENLSDQHIEAWHMIAVGATSKIYAKRARTSRHEVLRRVRALREFVGAANDPHLVTLGWMYGVLDDSLTEMATGHVLRPPTHAGQGRRRNSDVRVHAEAGNDPQAATPSADRHRTPPHAPSSSHRTRRPLLPESVVI